MDAISLESLIQRAIGYHQGGDYSRAITVYKGLIRRGHKTARILANMGAALYETTCVNEGLGLIEAALELDSTYEDAWSSLQIHALRTADSESVLAIAEKFIASDADNKRACYTKAQALMAVGSFSASVQFLEQLIKIYPDDLELRKSIASSHLASGDLDSALGHLLYILSLSPGDAFASIQLCEIAAKNGDNESSIAILLSAHSINPEDPGLIRRIAREYQTRGMMHDAIHMYELALSVDPDSSEIMAGMAYCYSEIGEIVKFFQIYDYLIARKSIAPEILIPLIFVCSIQGEKYLERLDEYSRMYWNCYGDESLEDDPLISSPAMTAASCVSLPPDSQATRRRKVGILTGGLGTHVESCFLASFLLNYSKDLLDVEVISNRWLNDGVSAVLSRAVNRCHSISNLSRASARELILEQEYDVIIETTGFTSGSAMNVISCRCAPVQCHWIGYHASTYMPTMDFYIGDKIITPESHCNRFSEQIYRLNRAWLASTPFTAVPEASPPNDKEVILGSFSQIAKLTTQTLELWSQILLSAPQCKILLKDKFTGDAVVVERILSFFVSKGIDPRRIVFKPRSIDWFQHMAMYNAIDIALDTTPWSSATTAFDCLSMGVPMIGIKGKTTSGLMSSSVLFHCGKESWVANSKEEFLEKNLRLIEKFENVRREKRDLQAEVLRSQLFDGVNMAREIELFLQRV